MIIKIKINFIFIFFLCVVINTTYAQKIKVYKIDNLLNRINNSNDTLYIVNFWATWCKPCVAELPDFNKIDSVYKVQKIKVLLVSLDFKEDIKIKLIPFIKKHNYNAEIVVLDEVNGNDFINKVSADWSGAIPATLFTNNNKKIIEFYEKKLNFDFVSERIKASRIKRDE